MKPLPQLFGVRPSTGAARWHAPSLRYFPTRFDLRGFLRPGTGALRPIFTAALLLRTIGSAFAATHYVDVNSTNATPPYTNWATAATNIQNAVDAAVAGDEIVVTNGTYATGGRNGNRVNVDKPLSVQSVNGPQVTIVNGGGDNRCAWLSNGASLSGFSLTNGFVYEDNGGGAYGGTLNNCWLIHNSALDDGFSGNGGGAAYCTLNNCTLTGNSAAEDFDTSVPNSGDYGSGGGAYYCTLNSCTLSGNSAAVSFPNGNWVVNGSYGDGGGAARCTLNNCVLTANAANIARLPTGSLVADAGDGGGAYICTLNSCTLSGNSAFDWGGGGYYCVMNNCIIYFNNNGANDFAANYYSGVLSYCCTTPFSGGITNAPLFVDTNGWANLRLQSNSPCINAGNNAFAPAGPDLDGNPRIVGGTVDIGAYEYQSLSLINFGVVSNQAGFNITGQSNQVVTIETSTDLLNWSPLATNTLNGHPFPFSDPTPATLPRRFYRAQAQ